MYDNDPESTWATDEYLERMEMEMRLGRQEEFEAEHPELAALLRGEVRS
jgi:hypothetical protein